MSLYKWIQKIYMQREIDRDRVTNSMLLWALDCSYKSSKFSVTWFFVCGMDFVGRWWSNLVDRNPQRAIVR